MTIVKFLKGVIGFGERLINRSKQLRRAKAVFYFLCLLRPLYGHLSLRHSNSSNGFLRIIQGDFCGNPKNLKPLAFHKTIPLLVSLYGFRGRMVSSSINLYYQQFIHQKIKPIATNRHLHLQFQFFS